MLTKPTVSTLRSLLSLSGSTMWPEVNTYLTGELDSLYTALSESRDEAILRQLQGRAQFIREFLAMVRDARPLLEKHRDSSL